MVFLVAPNTKRGHIRGVERNNKQQKDNEH